MTAAIPGDADLNGKVDVADLGILATNWQSQGVWNSGDFTQDRFVDVGDLGLLATNWQVGVSGPLGPSLSEALTSLGLSHANVPEPAAPVLVVGLTFLSAAPRLRKRCR